jgi:O-antigen ligase
MFHDTAGWRFSVDRLAFLENHSRLRRVAQLFVDFATALCALIMLYTSLFFIGTVTGGVLPLSTSDYLWMPLKGLLVCGVLAVLVFALKSCPAWIMNGSTNETTTTSHVETI